MQPKKRSVVNEQQLQKIFTHMMVTVLERHYNPDTPTPSVTVKKDELVRMVHNVNYSCSIKTVMAREPSPIMNKRIQVSNEQTNRMVAKLLTIENTMEDDVYVEGFNKGTIFCGNKYYEMSGFEVIAAPE